MAKKYGIVTAGDVNVFASILGGLIATVKRLTVPDENVTIVSVAFNIFDEFKKQEAERASEIAKAALSK